MSSAICFNFDQSKILSSGNGLNKESIRLNLQSPSPYPEFELFLIMNTN